MKGIYCEISENVEEPVSFILDDKIDLPQMGLNDVRIKVKACGISLPQHKVLRELFAKSPRLQYPFGHEVSGEVVEIGPLVSNMEVGDKIAGMLSLDSSCSGCAEYCIMNEFNLVRMPAGVSYVEAAAVVKEGLKAYTALHYQARLCGGDTLLIMDAASAFGTLCIQLAMHWGAKIICACSSPDEKIYLEQTFPSLARIVDISGSNKFLVSTVMEETGGVGVDCVIDNKVEMFSSPDDKKLAENESPFPKPSKHEIISTLAVGGRWVTSQPDLQLDPPESNQLFLRSASIAFLFEHTWALSTSQHGRYQHVLKDIFTKVANGTLKPHITKTMSLENVMDILKTLRLHRIGKVVAAM